MNCTCATLPWRRKGRRRVMRRELCSLSFMNLLILKETMDRWGRCGEGGSERQAADHRQLRSGHSHSPYGSIISTVSGCLGGSWCQGCHQAGNDPLKVLHTIFQCNSIGSITTEELFSPMLYREKLRPRGRGCSVLGSISGSVTLAFLELKGSSSFHYRTHKSGQNLAITYRNLEM